MSTTENDARTLAAVARQAADDAVKRAGGIPLSIVQVPLDDYVSMLRALSACADGRHTEALQRLADVFRTPIDSWRATAVAKSVK